MSTNGRVQYRSRAKSEVTGFQLCVSRHLHARLATLPPGTRSAVISKIVSDWMNTYCDLEGYEIALKVLSDFNLSKHKV